MHGGCPSPIRKKLSFILPSNTKETYITIYVVLRFVILFWRDGGATLNEKTEKFQTKSSDTQTIQLFPPSRKDYADFVTNSYTDV